MTGAPPRLAIAAAALFLLPAAQRPLPADVRAFIDRRAQCVHWADEDGYDRARAARIRAAMAKLRCDRLDQDEGKLRSRHAARPDVLAALDAEAGE